MIIIKDDDFAVLLLVRNAPSKNKLGLFNLFNCQNACKTNMIDVYYRYVIIDLAGKKCKICLRKTMITFLHPIFLHSMLFGNLVNDSKERKNPGWIVCAVRITLLAVLYLNPTNDFSHLS